MKSKLSKKIQPIFFFIIMLLTFYAVFSKNDLTQIITSLRKLNPFYFICASFSAVFFVCMEGFMIWFLLKACLETNRCHSSTHVQPTGNQVSLFRCFSYSFIGFFFSGITPSATGGQPAQLIAMKKDNIPLGSSSLVLMVVAVFYKLILVIIGAVILLFWKEELAGYFGNYLMLFYLGILLNALLVFFLLLVMFHGKWMERLFVYVEKFCEKIRICKPSSKRKEAFHHLISDYEETLQFLISHPAKILLTAICTLLQRSSLFLLTCLIYQGFGLSGHGTLLIMALQASVYISIDMLPLPGSQGISELVYASVFASVFTETYLASSMCVTRGLSFYFLLILGSVISLFYSRGQRAK